MVAQQNHCVATTKTLSHTIKPYNKTVIASIPQNIGFVQDQRSSSKIIIQDPKKYQHKYQLEKCDPYKIPN